MSYMPLTSAELTDDDKALATAGLDPGGNRIAHWKPVYTKILIMIYHNKSREEIARATKVSLDTVSRVKSMPLFRAKLLALTKRIQERTFSKLAETESDKGVDKAREYLKKHAFRAAKKVAGVMRKGTPQDRIRFDAAKDILERVGIKPAQIIETHERVYDPKEVQSASETLIELETHLARLSNNGSPYVLKAPQELLEDETTGSSQTDTGSMQENSIPPLEAPNPDNSSAEQPSS